MYHERKGGAEVEVERRKCRAGTTNIRKSFQQKKLSPANSLLLDSLHFVKPSSL